MTDSSSKSDDNSNMEIEVENRARRLATNLITSHVLKYVVKEKKKTSILSSHKWLVELKEGNENRFFEQLRMRKHVFQQLEWKLTRNCGLMSTKHIGADESVAMFLYMMGHRTT